MKKLSLLGLPILALIGLTACEADTDPKIDTSATYKFVLNTPQFATQFIDLATNGNINFTVSQPNYGVTIVPVYDLEISLKEDFTPLSTEPVIDSEGEEHVVPGTYNLNLDGQEKGILVAKMSDIAAGINDLLGLYDQDMYEAAYPDGEGYVGPVYLRATSTLGDGQNATTTISNTITLSQVQGYAAFPSNALYLSVPGGGMGWDPMLPNIIYTGDDEATGAMICEGFAVINGEFKINDGDWDGSGNWGSSEDGTGALTAESDGSYTAKLIQNSQQNFNADNGVPAGLYYFKLLLTDAKNSNNNAEVGTMTITPITSITLPGEFNKWDTSSDEMIQGKEMYLWTISGISATSDGWKFAMNHSWNINLGINNNYNEEFEVKDPLIFNGANIFKDASSITLNLQQYPWTFTVD